MMSTYLPLIFLDEKVYHCHLCNSPFATKGTLKVHMRLHTGAKPFKCNQCDATFRTSGHRKCHMLGHNKEANKQNRAARQATRITEQLPQVNSSIGYNIQAITFYFSHHLLHSLIPNIDFSRHL